MCRNIPIRLTRSPLDEEDVMRRRIAVSLIIMPFLKSYITNRKLWLFPRFRQRKADGFGSPSAVAGRLLWLGNDTG